LIWPVSIVLPTGTGIDNNVWSFGTSSLFSREWVAGDHIIIEVAKALPLVPFLRERMAGFDKLVHQFARYILVPVLFHHYFRESGKGFLQVSQVMVGVSLLQIGHPLTNPFRQVMQCEGLQREFLHGLSPVPVTPGVA
jgi:hypothetical protein